MLKACVKLVNYLGTNHGKFGALLSTHSLSSLLSSPTPRAQLQLMTSSFPTFPLYISPAKIAVSPLIEHYFYPVSTAPTNNCNQINLKER